MKFKVEETRLKGAKVIIPEIYSDVRGCYIETFSERDLSHIIDDKFVQDNLSYNIKDFTFRGFHYQVPPYTQSKLVRVVHGEVVDIIIDLRGKSPTFMKHYSVVLNDYNNNMLYVPEGFGHGFITLSVNATLEYKVNKYYNKESSRTFTYKPNKTMSHKTFDEFIMSDADRNAKVFDVDNNPFKDWY